MVGFYYCIMKGFFDGCLGVENFKEVFFFIVNVKKKNLKGKNNYKG